MTPLRHAHLVYRRAVKSGKGIKPALKALQRVVHDMLRRELAEKRMGRAA